MDAEVVRTSDCVGLVLVKVIGAVLFCQPVYELTSVVPGGVPIFSEKMVPVSPKLFTVTTAGNEGAMHDPEVTVTV